MPHALATSKHLCSHANVMHLTPQGCSTVTGGLSPESRCLSSEDRWWCRAVRYIVVYKIRIATQRGEISYLGHMLIEKNKDFTVSSQFRSRLTQFRGV